ncbi:MAG: alpha/beta hydrolase domain-containing protein [Acidimicrobiia bacterium]
MIGPEVDGTPSLLAVRFDLAAVGYAVHEHFVTGAATSYSPAQPFGPDGRWDIRESGRAEFTTRLVVYRPEDPARGNGTVIVEWLNVTGGLDVPALWMMTHRHLIRDGYTWVGVSVQRVGIEGGGIMPGLGLRNAAPERYGALEHPGDAFSFDIFTQVAREVRGMLSERYGVRVQRVIGTGASQSAFHLTTYVNAVDPRDTELDGLLLQGRAGAGAPIEGWSFERFEPADNEARRRLLAGRDRIRDDARVPVMVVQSETDVFGRLGYLPARQRDGEHFCLWEVAGAAHCDTYFLCASPFDSGYLPVAELGAFIARADESGIPTAVPINSGPQMHFVLQRAFDALERWTRDGTHPPSADRLAADGEQRLDTDALGIARGGVRTPWVDVPSAVLSGLGQPGDMTELFGTTRPLADDARTARYPRGRDDYLEQFRAATGDAVAAGFLLAADSEEINALGATSW